MKSPRKSTRAGRRYYALALCSVAASHRQLAHSSPRAHAPPHPARIYTARPAPTPSPIRPAAWTPARIPPIGSATHFRANRPSVSCCKRRVFSSSCWYRESFLTIPKGKSQTDPLSKCPLYFTTLVPNLNMKAECDKYRASKAVECSMSIES